MAQFYASIQGNKSEATRMGTKNSGIEGHIRGWSIGCRVDCGYDAEKDMDFVDITLTKGSSGAGRKFIGRIYEDQFDNAEDHIRSR